LYLWLFGSSYLDTSLLGRKNWGILKAFVLQGGIMAEIHPPEIPALLLDRYQPEELLQQREHTQTWRGTDIQTQAPVTIKILDLQATADWQAYQLFEREATALQALNHPRIPPLLAFQAEPEQQRVVLVQGFITGDSLRARIKQGWRLNETQIRQLATQVLEILQVLHQADPPLIHRDIKPENLILDAHNQAYLIDFGAVRATDSNTYTVAGSFGYMAPEQLQGQAVPVSDLYSLGMTLIELISGIPLAQLPRQGLYVNFHEYFTVSEGLKRWLDHLVAPYPVQRFPSASEALKALAAPEYVPALKHRETLSASHGKQQLTPFIWLQSSPEQVQIEWIGQQLSLPSALFYLATALGIFALCFLPLTLVIIDDLYFSIFPAWSQLQTLGAFTLITAVIIPLTTWLFRHNIGRSAATHLLSLTNEGLTHAFTPSRGLRKKKVLTRQFPLKNIQRIRLLPFHVDIHLTGWRPRYRFTLLVPFAKSIRTQIAHSLQQRGIQTDV
jgi:serine/threonine protein kinase